MRIRPGSITTRLPKSLSAWVETTSATVSASVAFERRSSSSKIMPQIFEAQANDHLAKIAILGNENAVLCVCRIEDNRVWRA
jgi:hypothetical protein